VNYIVDTPLMGFAAFIIAYIGALNLSAYFPLPTHTPADLDRRHEVAPIYGPGIFYSWLLGVNSFMYDVYYSPPHGSPSARPTFDKARLLLIVGYGAMAIGEQVVRAWLNDFGPTEAAARYVGDKAFESLAILCATRIWSVYLRRRASRKMLPVGEADRPSCETYVFWVPFIMLFAWGIGRALEHGKHVYVAPRYVKGAEDLQWRGIPYKYRPLSLAVGVSLGFFSVPGTWRDRLAEGFPCTVWCSMFLLHSGLFGTLTPLRLTGNSLEDRDQWFPLVLSMVAVAWQYWGDIRGIPWAICKRVGNVLKWKID
jgi:hypothetical protein